MTLRTGRRSGRRWGGFVFIIRRAPAAIRAYTWRILPRILQTGRAMMSTSPVNIRKTSSANWKACIEGFIESMHVAELHAQASPFIGDSSQQYDVWRGNENISRFLEPSGVQSEEIAVTRFSEQQIYAAMMRTMTGSGDSPPLPAGTRARTAMADLSRKVMSELDGRDYSQMSDTEALDPAQYSIFPNIVIFRHSDFRTCTVPAAARTTRTARTSTS
jgi:hypothetical protein